MQPSLNYVIFFNVNTFRRLILAGPVYRRNCLKMVNTEETKADHCIGVSDFNDRLLERMRGGKRKRGMQVEGSTELDGTLLSETVFINV